MLQAHLLLKMVKHLQPTSDWEVLFKTGNRIKARTNERKKDRCHPSRSQKKKKTFNQEKYIYIVKNDNKHWNLNVFGNFQKKAKFRPKSCAE